MEIILSLFDLSGNWSKPYKDNGYEVIQVDIELGKDIFDINPQELPPIYGILAAPPCTDFSLSGSRFFAEKDADGTTDESLRLVDKTLEIIKYTQPHFWCIENPMSRIHKLRPELGKVQYQFDPYNHGDPWKKRTWLWGKFNKPERNNVEPTEGRLIYKVGGKSKQTKQFRSVTPPGFAQAFYEANP